MSRFSQTLQKLFDNTELFTRSEWARFLGIPESSISEWLEDKSLPRPDLIRMTIDLVENSAEAKKEYLNEFEGMTNLPSAEISRLFHLMGNTLNDYMNETFMDLGRRLRNLSVSQQIKVLEKGCIGPVTS